MESISLQAFCKQRGGCSSCVSWRTLKLSKIHLNPSPQRIHSELFLPPLSFPSQLINGVLKPEQYSLNFVHVPLPRLHINVMLPELVIHFSPDMDQIYAFWKHSAFCQHLPMLSIRLFLFPSFLYLTTAFSPSNTVSSSFMPWMELCWVLSEVDVAEISLSIFSPNSRIPPDCLMRRS